MQSDYANGGDFDLRFGHQQFYLRASHGYDACVEHTGNYGYSSVSFSVYNFCDCLGLTR